VRFILHAPSVPLPSLRTPGYPLGAALRISDPLKRRHRPPHRARDLPSPLLTAVPLTPLPSGEGGRQSRPGEGGYLSGVPRFPSPAYATAAQTQHLPSSTPSDRVAPKTRRSPRRLATSPAPETDPPEIFLRPTIRDTASATSAGCPGPRTP